MPRSGESNPPQPEAKESGLARRYRVPRTESMSIFRAAFVGLAVLALFGYRQWAAPQGTAEESKSPFIAMFDGKSLKGWTPMMRQGAEPDAWYVENGIIVGDGDRGIGYLAYDRPDIEDFEMIFQYRFPGKGNSGVNIRATKDPTGKRDFQGYHADLGHVGIGRNVLGAWDFHTPGRREHGCFRGDRLVIDVNDRPAVTPLAGAVQLADIRKGGWNEVRLLVRDNRFQFFLNGKPSAEFIEHLPESKRHRRGLIQLQLHDPGMIVQFRELKIRIFK